MLSMFFFQKQQSLLMLLELILCRYHANIQWGTIKDYFAEIRKRMKEFPTLQGDFFPYSDIFAEGRPAYWTGYFTTRPYWKMLDRQLQAVLRSAEILFSWAWVTANQSDNYKVARFLAEQYENLSKARENMAIFQHHDGITGTSKAHVMIDYARKMYSSYLDSLFISSRCVQYLMTPKNASWPANSNPDLSKMKQDFERPTYDQLPEKIPLETEHQEQKIIIFNSHGQRRFELIKILTTTDAFSIVDSSDNDILFQINPVWNDTGSGLLIMGTQYEVFFIADLPALTLSTFVIKPRRNANTAERKSVVFSNYYAKHPSNYKPKFETRDILPGDIQIDSDNIKLIFNGGSGLLKSVTNKRSGKTSKASIRFASYPSAQFKSGAYLFKPDPSIRDPTEDVLEGAKPRIFIHSGPITSEITVMFGSALIHTIRIFHVDHEPMKSAIYLENTFNLGDKYNSTETPGFPINYRETELFMRITSDVENGENPVFYTDQSGLHMQKRIKVESVGSEGNKIK